MAKSMVFRVPCPVASCLWSSSIEDEERDARSQLNAHLLEFHEPHYWRNILSDIAPIDCYIKDPR